MYKECQGNFWVKLWIRGSAWCAMETLKEDRLHTYSWNCNNAAAVEQSCNRVDGIWHWKHLYIPTFVVKDCVCLMWALCSRTYGCGCMYVCACVCMCLCLCGHFTINAAADQRLSRSMLLIECSGRCACASQHLWAELTLVHKCQPSSSH